MGIYLKINEIRDKIVDILIEKYCNTYRNTFENIAIYRDTKISHNTQPYLYFFSGRFPKKNFIMYIPLPKYSGISHKQCIKPP